MPHSEAAVKFAVCKFLEVASKRYAATAVKRAILVREDNPKWPQTCYIAADFIHKKNRKIITHAACVPLRYSDKYGALAAEDPYIECFGMPCYRCPPYILEVLSPPATEISAKWRHRCASVQWRYELIVRENADNQRDILVVLSDCKETSLVDCALNIPPSRFEKVYEQLIREYQMANIPSLIKASNA